MSAILETFALSRHFGGLKAVNEVSFALDPGSIVALIGPNGAGKTTCFNLLSGIIKPSSGRVAFQGIDITTQPTHHRARLGVGRTFQIAATFRSMTVLENVEVALMAANANKGDAKKLMEELGIAAHSNRLITELAYGDIKRVELAMTLANSPAILLLDEPTAGMGVNERHAIMELISELAQARGTTVLFTEHDMNSVFEFAERILVMDQGELIADGAPENIRANPVVQQVYLGNEEISDA